MQTVRLKRFGLILAVILVVSIISTIYIGGEQNAEVGIANCNANGVLNYSSNSDEYVYVSGKPIGISICANGLIVAGIQGVQTNNGEVYPTKNLDIRVGDVLVSLNGEEVHSVYQFRKIVNECEVVEATLTRRDSSYCINLRGVVDKVSGERKVGLLLKEDIGGIGTMTFITNDGQFAALGHHIQDSETGLSNTLNNGKIFNTSIYDVIKGERGKAGGLVGEVNRLSQSIGDICNNTNIGLYGRYEGEIAGKLYRVAKKGEAKIGKAQVLTTIDGDTPKLYDIEIVKVISQSSPSEKGMVINVCDEELLLKTGGIVQGMSGSPIIQNGILIGAVTHVFIQDSSRGYAIHSRFMYEYANNVKTSNLTTQTNQLLVA